MQGGDWAEGFPQAMIEPNHQGFSNSRVYQLRIYSLLRLGVAQETNPRVKNQN